MPSRAASLVLEELIRRGAYKPPKPHAEDAADPSVPASEWARRYFPQAVSAPFGERHLRLWEWAAKLEAGKPSEPFAAIWPRGSGKSTNAELVCVYAGARLSRRFALYVCATQEQANQHVDAVRSWFEQLGVGMMLSAHGQSRGWKANKLRCENGFSVMAVGLDVYTRGLKIDQYRPDLIVLDDIDSEDDSRQTVVKKIRRITSSILPAGSSHTAILFVQNLVHENGVMAQIADGRAEFLHGIEVDGPHPAVEGLQVERSAGEDGRRRYRIVAGRATWDGQPLDVCEEQINAWGYHAFLREAQHEVKGAAGVFFKTDAMRVVDALPDGVRLERLVVPCDFAATEGAGDYTAIGLMASLSTGEVALIDLFHEQRSWDRVRAALFSLSRQWQETFGMLTVLLPRDPGQSGIFQSEQLCQNLREAGLDAKIVAVNGSKAVRARKAQEIVNGGDLLILRASWNAEFLDELRLFREDKSHDHDDMVDMLADGCNELTHSGWATTASGIKQLAELLARR